jgi:hypothetical protein
MARIVGRRPVEIKISTQLDGYVPVFNGSTRLWEAVNKNDFITSSATISGSNIFTGNQTISGSLTVYQGITGSLFGTASYADNAWAIGGNTFSGGDTSRILGTLSNHHLSIFVSGSRVATFTNSGSLFVASYLPNNLNNDKFLVDAGVTTSTNLIQALSDINNYSQINIQNFSTGSNASSDIVATANNGSELGQYVNMGINSSTFTGSVGDANDAYLYSTGNDLHIGNASNYPVQFFAGGIDNNANRKLQLNPNNLHQMTGSLDISGSVVARSFTGSLQGSSSYALTSSYADNFTVAGTLTAQTIVAQTITSSVEFITGSTQFGSLLSDTHQFTGSVSVTGSLEINGRNYINDSSSFESRITTNSSSFASFSGSYVSESSSFASRITTNSASISSLSASFNLFSGSFMTGSFTGSFTGSLLGTASYATQALSASYWSGSIINAATASHAPDYLPLAGGTMTGDIYAAGRAFTFQDLLLGAGTTFGKITTDGTKYISIMPDYNVESARFWPNGNVTIQNAGTYVDNGFRLDVSGSGRFTDGLTVTGSLNATNGITGSLLGTASQASTASSADNFTVRGTLTAQTLVAQTITSSTEFITGSTKNGSLLSNTHQFTGSVGITGSLSVNGSDYITTSGSASTRLTALETFSGAYSTGSFTGSFIGRVTGSFSGSLYNLQNTSLGHIPFFSSSQVLADSIVRQLDNGTGSYSIVINQDNITTAAPEALYVWQPSNTSFNVIAGKGNLDNYLQLNIQNLNTGENASSDVVATANNGNESINYIDMGINSEGFTGSIGDANDAYLYSTGNHLHIGNASNQYVGFFAGGHDVDTNMKLILDPNNLHQMTGSLGVSGSIIAKSFTGSLQGTASWANNAINATSASYAVTASLAINANNAINAATASYVLNAQSASYWSGSIINAATASYVLQAVSASFATTASYAQNAISASFASTASSVNRLNQNVVISGSLTVTGSTNIIGDSGTTILSSNADTLVFTGSFYTTGSIVSTGSLNILGGVTGSLLGTASYAAQALTSSFAATASSADNFTVRGTLTAQTLVAQTITSSIEFVTGSTRNGSTTANTHQFTGSVSITGSLAINGVDYNSTSASFETRILNNSGSIAQLSGSYLSDSSSFANRATNNSASIALLSGSYLSDSSSFAVRATNNSASISSLSGSYLADSASFNTRINVISSSYATTGSNIFVGNQIITGSFAVSGSTTQIGNNTLSGSITVTGSVNAKADINLGGVLRLDPATDPGSSNLTSSFLFTSASNTATGYDLYYRQGSNKVKFKWFEGVLNTGILYGGVLTYSSSYFYVSSGSGIIVNHNAATGSEISPTITYVNWAASSHSIANTGSQNTYVFIDANGDVQQQTSFFTPEQYHEALPIGRISHYGSTGSLVTGVGNNMLTSYDLPQQLGQFTRAFGPLKISGFTITPQVGNLSLNIGSGTAFNLGGYYQNTPDLPSTYNSNTYLTSSIIRIHRSGSGFLFDNNGGSYYTSVDPTLYDDGTGILATVGNGNWSIQRVFVNPITGRSHVYYGQSTYTTYLNAVQSVSTDDFVESEVTKNAYVFAGYLVMQGGVANTDLSVGGTTNAIVQAGLFRNSVGGSGGATTAVSELNDLSDVNISSPSNGQALIYSTGTWINGTPISSSYAATASFVNGISNGTASYANTASFAITASYLLGQSPTSSYALTASYVENAQSASYVLNAQSASYWSGSILNATSASYAATASYANDFTVAGTLTAQTIVAQTITSSIEFITGSTRNGSLLTNTHEFTGSVLITGSLAINGSNAILTNQTSSMSVATASFITLAQTASYVENAQTASYVTQAQSASYWSGSIINAATASYVENAQTASYVVQAQSASYWSGSIINATSASYANNATSASYALTASYASNVPETASYALVANSSSYALTASYAANVPETASYALFANSASFALTASYISGSVAGFPFSGSAIITGSLLVSQSFVDFTQATYVTGSFTGSLSGTATSASYASYALFAGNSPGSTATMTQSVAATTWSFTHNLNTRNPLLQVYDSTNHQVVPLEIIGSDPNQATIYFDVAESGYAVASNGGTLTVSGSTARLDQTSAAVTWSFTHNLATKYPNFEIWDSNDSVVIPAGIHAVSDMAAEIYFAFPSTGVAIASFSGIAGSPNATTASYAVSSSYASASFNFIVANQLTIDQTLTDYHTVASSAPGENNMFNRSTGSFSSAFFKYTVANGSNARAGEVMAVWAGGSIQYTDNSTSDIGDTSGVTAEAVIAAGAVQFNLNTATSGWKLKSLGTFM